MSPKSGKWQWRQGLPVWLFLWRQVVNVSKLTCLQNPKRDEGDLISIDTGDKVSSDIGDKVSSEPGDKKKLHGNSEESSLCKIIKFLKYNLHVKQIVQQYTIQQYNLTYCSFEERNRIFPFIFL